ncbi:hypothetical protein HOLleu_03061 [Holothuria leucospilota]|uniref:Reverse transcriptase/retrotransposon-derived protein RNase H-like domain-containing protein n=1 Tax=Holothuria leucospilota TaxID=206669 RepID=A0A9Q1CSE4_HOLLE|nr:hypothetical protein HOLleu_03061 [Holothuria leucospilota]
MGWTAECHEAFEASKKMLIENSVLVHYDVSKPFGVSVRCVSVRNRRRYLTFFSDGQEHPIAFASRTLSKSEKNYAQIEREALSLIFEVKKFHKYLHGRKFELVTDHQLLTGYSEPPNLPSPHWQRRACSVEQSYC